MRHDKAASEHGAAPRSVGGGQSSGQADRRPSPAASDVNDRQALRFLPAAVQHRFMAREYGPVAEIGLRGSLLRRKRESDQGRLAPAPGAGPARRTRPARVPFYPQVEASDCGTAALAMSLAFHGVDVSIAELRRDLAVGRDGISARAMLEAARRYGLHARGVRSTLDGLRQLPPGCILYWEFAHFVVLERATSTFLQVVDPAFGRRRIAWEQASASFTGIALELTRPLGAARGRRRLVARDSPWRYIRHFFPTGGIWLVIVGASLPLLLGAFVVPIAMDRLIANGADSVSREFAAWLIGSITVAVAYFCLRYVRGAAVITMQNRADKNVTLGVLQHLLALPYSYFVNRSSGDLALRIRTSTFVRQTLTTSALSATFDGTLIFVYLGILVVFDKPLSAVVIALALGQAGLLVLAWRRQEMLSADAMECQARAQGELIELLEGLPTLKAAGLEDVAGEKWTHSLVAEINSRSRSARSRDLATAMSAVLQFVAPIVVLLVGVFQVSSGAASLGKVLGFSTLAMGVFAPISTLVLTGLQVAGLGATLGRLSDILDTPPDEQRADLKAVEEISGDLSLDTVSFAYPGTRQVPVLHDVSFSVAAGEAVVIMGASGSGKSTLAALLAGLYAPTSGAVRIDGRDIAEVDRTTLRRRIGYVNQDSQLFAGSIRDNIQLGCDGVAEDQMVEAARLAGLHADVVAMPMRYETLVSARGSGLSGGQKQRIALARMLVRTPGLMILDEATSALDPPLEEEIMSNLLGLARTLIVISHRPSIAASSDRILLVDRGGLVDAGTDRELRKRSAYYRRLTMSVLGSPG